MRTLQKEPCVKGSLFLQYFIDKVRERGLLIVRQALDGAFQERVYLFAIAEKLFEAHAQCVAKERKGFYGGVALTKLDLAQVALRNARKVGELVCGYPALLPQVNKSFCNIHKFKAPFTIYYK